MVGSRAVCGILPVLVRVGILRRRDKHIPVASMLSVMITTSWTHCAELSGRRFLCGRNRLQVRLIVQVMMNGLRRDSKGR